MIIKYTVLFSTQLIIISSNNTVILTDIAQEKYVNFFKIQKCDLRFFKVTCQKTQNVVQVSES